MPINRPTLPELRNRIGADIARHTNGDANLRGSLEFALRQVLSGVAHTLYGFQEYIKNQMFDDTASEENLIRRAGEFGLTRIAAKKATGTITATGTDSTVIPAGAEWFIGEQFYTVDANATISGGTAAVAVTAKEAGSLGNQDAAASIQIVTPITGLSGPTLPGTLMATLICAALSNLLCAKFYQAWPILCMGFRSTLKIRCSTTPRARKI